ncbi:PREDICTED: eukaryotic translation initiation factor 5-like [Amphimedon queenslandica]|uniref:Eukaryotic translation initiation factor 5 n=2 Tax=Amphimedon queenslandica TaxID=400682 RepID=A0AAN0IB43_AMPQE|nr:PREDICTED: eukaryotic translation initiation factor 5-like [Amphimedon queenslandica]|eukprot:XP_003384405.1 PREDICTED: eukaryotic translation initiation factor 5-like [Amphimedon queenslandica]
MAFVNVNRENTDPYYRYKMPLLIAKVEGKGNGIKTVIVNMVEIGKALQRPPSYPCKYFGCELGAQTQMDPKNGRYIVNGAHEGPKLQDLLDGFIKNFVLCEECENPETNLVVQTGKNRIVQTCIACGHSRLVSERHKLTAYVIKNPPHLAAGGADDAATGGKKDRKGKKGKGKKEKEPTSPSVASPNDIDKEFDVAVPQQNGTSHKGKNKDKNADDDDEEWSVDTSEEAVRKRLENLSEGATVLTLNDDLEKSNSERVNMFYKHVEGIKANGGIPAIASSLSKIKGEAERLEVLDTAAGIMAELLYTDNLLSEIKQYRAIMLHFVHENKKAQKTLLDAFEILVGKVYPDVLLPRVPHILKSFYDEDILEEESILEWHDKVSKKLVGKEKAREIREKAAPIIQWLKTAEEESSEDEDDVEVVYENETAGDKLKVVSETIPAGKVINEAVDDDDDDDEEEEVNIDDI